ncbi:MAG: hypothetical protein IJH63_10135 [Methanobrevibacter sp.]|nr:hypothetical protein [Methanosphaera sp.]MBR0371057.1 hypothetical protein [Methanobrevibacter sp.]
MELERGIIIHVDYKYDKYYGDRMFLELIIRLYSWGQCMMIFKSEKKIKELLKQFYYKNQDEMCISSLLHEEVYMLPDPKVFTNVPHAIAHYPPREDNEYRWIYNDNKKD